MVESQEARRIAEQLERLASDLSLGLRIETEQLEDDENALLRAAVLLKEHKERERLLKEEINHGRAIKGKLLTEQADLRDRIDAARHHFEQIDQQHLSAQPPPQAFWDRFAAIRQFVAPPVEAEAPERGER